MAIRARGISVNHFSIFIERAVVAPYISKVDTDRHLILGLSAWNFRDEVQRRGFHGNSLSPVRKTCLSHFSVLLLGHSRRQARLDPGEKIRVRNVC
jgi:hypothetical protein